MLLDYNKNLDAGMLLVEWPLRVTRLETIFLTWNVKVLIVFPAYIQYVT